MRYKALVFHTLAVRGDIERYFDAIVVSSEIGHAKLPALKEELGQV